MSAPYTPQERAVIATLEGQLAVFRGLINECLNLITTLEPECDSEAMELELLVRQLKAAVDGSLVLPLFVLEAS